MAQAKPHSHDPMCTHCGGSGGSIIPLPEPSNTRCNLENFFKCRSEEDLVECFATAKRRIDISYGNIEILRLKDEDQFRLYQGTIFIGFRSTEIILCYFRHWWYKPAYFHW